MFFGICEWVYNTLKAHLLPNYVYPKILELSIVFNAYLSISLWGIGGKEKY